ncbi:MAG: formylglycine-generating enzyme family protein [Magnetovibrio sp.]|nr:formylglycine-generating enzyme family protein [Magnetovibrio sp.]
MALPVKLFSMHMKMIIFLVAVLFGGEAYAESAAPTRHIGLKDCATCPELAIIPPGDFIMGSDGPHKYERPATLVTIDKTFAMGMFEVSFDEWQACVDDGGACGTEIPNDHDWGRGNRPVINITWADANLYTDWLTQKTGHTYRLPSEAEWEYAARAGSNTAFWWGDDIGKSLANCRNCGPKISHQSLPVDSFKANPWGLYNVHGNVWEWVADCWNTSHDTAHTDGSSRQTGDCRQRVVRSGSWYYFSKNLRSAWRFKNDSRIKSYGIGFRVLRELP